MNLEGDDKFFARPVDLLCGCIFGSEESRRREARVEKEEGSGGKLGEEFREQSGRVSRLLDC